MAAGNKAPGAPKAGAGREGMAKAGRLHARAPWYAKIPGYGLVRTTHGLQRVMLLTGAGLIALFLLLALTAQWISPYDFDQTKYQGVPFGTQRPPSAEHWFGTTVAGYDVFARVVYGARTALMVVVMAVAASILIGVALGVVSGYLGGWLDRLLVLITDALYAFPSLLMAIIVSIVVSSGRSSAIAGMISASLAITVIFIPQYFRVVRNATISAKTEPYVDAARVAGSKSGRIMFGHVLPNVSQTIPVLTTLNASESILTLAALGFLGFGIEPTSAAEWGYDLNKATTSDVANGIWWTSVFPGLAIVLVVAGVTLIGESLNDVLNPLLRTRGGATTADEEELVEVVLAEVGDRRAPLERVSYNPDSPDAGRPSPGGGGLAGQGEGAGGVAGAAARTASGDGGLADPGEGAGAGAIAETASGDGGLAGPGEGAAGVAGAAARTASGDEGLAELDESPSGGDPAGTGEGERP
ncbi:MAG: ABC transporter permease [Bifidobacteriaceae bacterium]|jgi:peptide/nickel transport system permease protein|nr:ABC transporter permease [Bifidobacteriaceae bacterium]